MHGADAHPELALPFAVLNRIPAVAPAPPSLRQLAVRGLWSSAVVLGLLALAVYAAASADITEEAVRAVWARSDPRAFIFAFALMTTGFCFLALRWRTMMTDRSRVTVAPLTGFLVIGTLLNYALPGPVGEFAAAGLAARRFRLPAEMVFAASVHARFIGLAVAGAASALLFVATDMPVPDGMRPWVGMATAAIACGAVALGVLSSYPAVLREVSARTIGRIPPLRGLHASVERLALSLRDVGRLGPRRYAWGAWWALCGHACVIGGIAIAAYGIGAAPNAAGLAFTYAVATAGAVVLFALPGSQLGWDAMFASLLVATAGLSLADALAITLLVRAQQLFVVLLGGVALLRVTTGPMDDTGPLNG